MFRNKLFIFCLLVCIYEQNTLNLEILENKNTPIVEIKDGKLIGKYMDTRYGRKFMGFLSIPYAKPPINQLRFKDPLPSEPWEGVLNASEEVPFCPQKDLDGTIIGTEDCLYLNVYTPQLIGNESLPVIVNYPSGAWTNGGAQTTFFGPDYLLDQNIVLVTCNYRLGPLGYFSTGDDTVPGNMAMKDQVLVLRWIQENIDKFGGDKNSVTIFGDSALGASVHYHMLSPMSKGLFHRAIIQSGTALCPWALTYDGEIKEKSEKIAQFFNCSTNNSNKMVKCLQNVHVYDIIDTFNLFVDWYTSYLVFPFKPIIEHEHSNAFLTENPYQIIKQGKINSVPIIIGFTSGEGSIVAATAYDTANSLKQFVQKIDENIPKLLNFEKSALDVTNITNQIKKFYFQNKEIGYDNIQEFINLFSDGMFTSGILNTIKLHLIYGNHPIFAYYFDYKPFLSTDGLHGSTKDYGVSHGNDMLLIFPFSKSIFPDRIMPENDRNMSDILIELRTTFAKTGIPTYKNKTFWKPVISENVEYLYINNDEDLNMKTNLLTDRYKFWKNLHIHMYQ